MGNKVDLLGQSFDHWTVIGQSSKTTQRGGLLWECRCSCGAIRSVDSQGLRRGTSRSCGCQAGSYIFLKSVKAQSPLNHFYSNHSDKGKAANHGCLPFDVWKSIATRPCSYCGSHEQNPGYILKYRSNARRRKQVPRIEFNEITAPRVNGIDRVDSSKSYTEDNSVSCCLQCNQMKLHYDKDQWIAHMRRIISYLDSKEKPRSTAGLS